MKDAEPLDQDTADTYTAFAHPVRDGRLTC
jgi:hypothetical protein